MVRVRSPMGRTLAAICSAGRRADLAASALARFDGGPVIHVDNRGGTLAALGVEMVTEDA